MPHCSGDMYPGVPPAHAGGGSPAAIGRCARWKSSSIGWPSPASEYVRRLDVHVQEVAVVGILQSIRQAGPDRADRLDVRSNAR